MDDIAEAPTVFMVQLGESLVRIEDMLGALFLALGFGLIAGGELRAGLTRHTSLTQNFLLHQIQRGACQRAEKGGVHHRTAL